MPDPAANHARWTVADLFSGCGGMSCGFDRHGRYKIVGAVDRQLGKPGRGESGGSSTGCNPTYASNIGVEPLDADIFELDPAVWRREHLGLERAELAVLISCAPCTGFSQKNAANHATDDRRNSLVTRTGDFVAELLPEVFVMENVKELLSGRNGHHFAGLRARLAQLGYHVSAGVHDLVDYGLPQLRKRALVIAHRDRDLPPLGALPRRAPRTVREAIGHLPALEAGATDPRDPMHACPRPNARSMERIRATPHDGGSWAELVGRRDDLLIPSMRRPGRRAGSFPDIYGRLWWDQPARTITRECAHPGNGRYLHPEQDRHLSVREMALLQGFPPEYRFEGRLTARYNQIGDAVPPLVSAQIAAHVASVLDGPPRA
jgi:DNA (cytosine-5)-methyltransferase 1